MGKKPKQKKIDPQQKEQVKPESQPEKKKNEQKESQKTVQKNSSSQLKAQKNGHHGRKHQNNKVQTHKKDESDRKSEKYPHYTWQEVGKHDHKGDSWVVIEENIYDVTKFMDQHPGGVKPIIHRAGRNATAKFQEGNHPPNVLSNKLGKWKLGRIQQDSMIESWQRQTKTGKMDAFCSLVLGLGLFGFTIYLTL